MQVTMKSLLQNTTARQSKVFFYSGSEAFVKFGDDILTSQKDVISQKSLLENGLCEICRFIKEESEQDVTLIPGQIHFLSCGKLLSTLFLYWYVFEYHFLVSMMLVFVQCLPRSFEKEFHHDYFCCFPYWFRCWLNLSCRLSSFSNKSLFILKLLVRLCYRIYCLSVHLQRNEIAC